MSTAITDKRLLTSTTDREHFKKIFSMIDKVPGFPYTSKEFLVWWIKNYSEKYFRVWIEIDESQNEIYSFMVAQIVKPLLEDEVFIPITYVDPKSDICHEFLKCAEGWAHVKGIKRISAYVYRNPAGFCEKYNFSKGHTEIYKNLIY